MNKMPVYFDMVGNLTIDNCDTKSIQVRTTGNKKNQFTCVLSVLADGWMDEVEMKTWFNKCSISNAIDGSEDDLFKQNEKEEIDENEREIVNVNSDSAEELNKSKNNEL
ncbi:hypothetical protein C1645_733359 [Glomus cerebriforme]|uniref:DDE-1 domain-containing protein n=1 Tax=Glomus cerebriforme TaxID=658196 RepID=A0A397TEK4_9GLOM|nr:hypothetical protein C1645_733359 [Glomus cerebriforme]